MIKEDIYVPWGHHDFVENIMKSEQFFPTFVCGMSGNGKTIMIIQAAKRLGREIVRVQINQETDEDDLIGGLRLVNGETVFQKGPVIQAMEAGKILLLDECDRGTNKLLALQGILEGEPVLIKKTGEIVEAKEGFNIFATANTKGQGSLDGRYSAASILDEAFLERFAITLEQPYPSAEIEREILLNHAKKYEVKEHVDVANDLTKWASHIRESFENESIEDTISTRRLCYIIQTQSINNNLEESVRHGLARFDTQTKSSFLALWQKMIGSKEKNRSSLRFNPDDLKVNQTSAKPADRPGFPAKIPPVSYIPKHNFGIKF